MLSRADVNDNVKSILGFPFANSRLFNVHLTLETMTESQFCVSVGYDGFRKSVSGRINLRALVLLSPALFLLSRSLALSSSFRLSLSFRFFLFSPSFLLSSSCNNTFVGRRTQNKIVASSRHRAYFMFVRSRKNLHTCKLPLAGSRSPIVKYARGSHIGFALPLYKPDTFVRASNAHYLHKFQ